MKLSRRLVSEFIFKWQTIFDLPLLYWDSVHGHNPGAYAKQETDFEAILDEIADQSDLQHRADYDAYCRRELPRLVRSHLESAVASQLQALESALRTQVDEIIANCLERLSASYQASRTTATALNGNEDSLPAPTPTQSLAPPTPMGVQHCHEHGNEADNITEFQHAPDYFTSPSRHFNQPPTPSGATVHEPYGQPVLGNWNPDDFSMSASLGADEMNLNWDDESFLRACL